MYGGAIGGGLGKGVALLLLRCYCFLLLQLLSLCRRDDRRGGSWLVV